MFTYFSEKFLEISTLILKYSTEVGTPMSELKFRFRNRNHNRNSDVEIKTEIEIPISKSNLKSKFRFRNRNSGKSKHRNFDEIKMKFRRNLDFVESNKNYFLGNPTRYKGVINTLNSML
jgi:Cu2+-containing amine oxidase